MKVFKYWTKDSVPVHTTAGSWNVTCYGGSNTSLDDALVNARAAAERSAEAIHAGRPRAQYDYTERGLREEIVEEVPGEGRSLGVVTRNSYGSLVLNTTLAFFVDMDLPQPEESLMTGLKRWFGKSPPKPDPGRAIIERVEAVARERRLGVRLYRTAAGFRGVVTDRVIDPESSDAQDLLAAFGSDPMYRRLCKAQACYRARLTPKYWRCNADPPPSRYPWPNAKEEDRYRVWEESYHRSTDTFAVCAPVGSFGVESIDRRLGRLIAYHDDMTCADGLELA